MLLFQKGNQHPELSSPVTDVILTDDVMSFKLIEPGDAVADDGTAQVSDMHLFGNIRSGIIDDHCLRSIGFINTQPVVVVIHFQQAVGEKVVFQPQIDKSRPSDFRRFADVIQFKLCHNLFGQFPWIGFNLLGGGHDAIGLVITECGNLRKGD